MVDFCTSVIQPADYVDLELAPEDWHWPETTPGLGTELRIVVLLLKQFHACGMTYPLRQPAEMAPLLPASKIMLGGVETSGHDIAAFFEAACFPVTNDATLAKAAYLAISRCKASMRRTAIDTGTAAAHSLA